VLRRSISGRGNSKYRIPEVGACLVCLRNYKEISIAGAGRKGRKEADEAHR
jgi:hypothetical protein